MEHETTNCPICGVDDADERLTARDINFYGPGDFQLVRCRQCSLTYVNPRPAADWMDAYYPPHYWSPPPTDDLPPYRDAGTRRSLAVLRRDYAGGRILDIGCAVGRMPAFLRTLGFDAVGLEPYERPCQVGRERYGIEIICASLHEANLEPGSFDALTFFDVLEHVDDPLGDLRRAHDLLKPGGSVFVKVPNIAALQARLFGKLWYWLDVPRHLWHFSPRSLRRALEAAGFADIWCKAIPEWEGAMVFETSVLYWLRGRHLAGRGIEVKPAQDQTVGEVLEGKVYPGVPSAGKRAFRWFVRNVLYLPLAVENLVGRSVEVLAIARKGGREV